MSPALNGSSAIRHFKGSDAIEIRDRITLDFYTGLPHNVFSFLCMKFSLFVALMKIFLKVKIPLIMLFDSLQEFCSSSLQ